MVILKGSTMRNFYKNIWQKARNHLSSNATTEATKSPKNMVDTVLDLPQRPFSNLLTLKRLKIKDKKVSTLWIFFSDEKITFFVDFGHQNLRWPIALWATEKWKLLWKVLCSEKVSLKHIFYGT